MPIILNDKQNIYEENIMRGIIAILKYLPHYIYFALQLIPFSFYKKKHSPRETWHKAYPIIKDHCKALIKSLSLKEVVMGEENIPKDENVVFISNHQGTFDVIFMIPYLKQATIYIAKEELKKMPVYGQWINNMGGLFLDRQDAREGLKLINEASRRISEEGMDGAIFPEGTRSRSLNMGEFQKGSFKMAQKANVKVVPVAVYDTYRPLESGEGIVTHIPIFLSFLPPVDVTNISREEGKTIHIKVQEMIKEELDRIGREVKPKYT